MERFFLSILIFCTLIFGVLEAQDGTLNSEELDIEKLEKRANKAYEKSEELKAEIAEAFQEGRDPRELREQYLKQLEEENRYREKLVEFDEFNPGYKFALADNLIRRNGSRQKGIELMQRLATEEAPTLLGPHLALVQHYALQGKQNGAPEMIAKAKKHISFALKIEPDNLTALNYKAYFASLERDFETAFNIYADISSKDPKYYKEVAKLARYGNDKKAIDRALKHYHAISDQKNNKNTEFADAIVYATAIYAAKDVEGGIKWLRSLLPNAADIAREIYIKQNLATLYANRAIAIGRNADMAAAQVQLDDLKTALDFDSDNRRALQWLTILGLRDDQVGKSTLEIYDPKYDPNPTWATLSELALFHMRNDEIEEALNLFERARKKNPREPSILNNLAYMHLKTTHPNPEQALLLVDQAIHHLSQSGNTVGRDKMLASFFDTRGEALLKLSRFRDAADAYKLVLQFRKNDVATIKNLIRSYDRFDDESANKYRRLLDELQEK